MEKILTKKEIEEAQKAALTFPIFNTPVVLLGAKSKNSIIGKSPTKALIMVWGNDDTGFQHIQKRHGYKYEYTEWKKDKPYELDVPTSFPEREILFLSLLKIADSIYKDENLSIKENHHKDDFDLYVGELKFEEKIYKCKLLLYKSSKIIHNIIPVVKKKAFNKNKPSGFHFVLGEMRCNLDFDKQEETLIIPYLDHLNKVVFQVDIARNMITKEELWILSCIKEDKVVRIPAEVKTTETKLEDRILHYKYFGLEEVKKEIVKISKMTLEELKKKCNQS